MMTNELGPTLETQRLILRPPVRDDFEHYAAMMADAENARFIGGLMKRAFSASAIIAA